jgi:alkanesulfonate monooxygenase
MGITLHWFLPTSGDSRNVVPGLGGHRRPASIDYLGQIARAAEDLGFDAVLTPTGTWCEDAWLGDRRAAGTRARHCSIAGDT